MDTCSKYFFSLINVFIFVCSLVLFAFATWMAHGSTFREVVTSDQGALLVFYAIYVLAGMLFALALITMLTDCRKKRSTRIAHMLATFIYLTFFLGFVAYGVSNVSSVESKLSEIWDSQVKQTNNWLKQDLVVVALPVTQNTPPLTTLHVYLILQMPLLIRGRLDVEQPFYQSWQNIIKAWSLYFQFSSFSRCSK